MPVPVRVAAFRQPGCPVCRACRFTPGFPGLSDRQGWVAYALRTRPPLSTPRRASPVRLACIRPAASVHPEPGSNSSLYYCLSDFFSVSLRSAFASFCLVLPRVPPRDRFPIRMALRLPAFFRATLPVLASSYQRTFQNSTLNRPSVPFVLGCKDTTLFQINNLFFHFFFLISLIILIIKMKKKLHNKK